jgi:CRISPR system Cascade subunit CasB
VSRKEVYKVSNKVLWNLSALIDTPVGKSNLAKLRNSIGKPLSQSIEIWPLIFEFMPEKFLSRTEEASNEEKSIIYSLQMYAFHQQGQSSSVLCTETEKYNNIGKSLKVLRVDENKTSIDRRFNTMITSSNFDELSYNLRQIIGILKSKAPEEKVDYAKLAEDMYRFLRGYDEDVRLDWAREYYRTNYNKKGEDENE